MRLNENLREQRKRGEAGYPFEIYRSDSSNFFVSNHWHDEIEFIYIARGTLYININNSEYMGGAGDIFIVNKNEMHGMYGKAENVEYYAFVFDLDMLSFSMDDYSQKHFIEPFTDEKNRFFNSLESTSEMREIFLRILKYNSEKKSGYMLATKAALLEFISLLIQNSQYSVAKTPLEDEVQNKLLKRIVLYIDKHLDEQITLSEISAEFNMVPKYFCRFFKKNFKMTFIEYVNSMKIELAELMLCQDEKSITEIAMRCGFSNISYFTRVFKKLTGYTPSKYKLMNNNK